MKTLLFPSIEDINEILAKRIDDLSEIQMVVSEIVNSVRKNGDESLQKWINKFEKYPVPIKDLKVKEEEFMKIDIPNDFEKSLKGFIKRVENFHKIQLEESRFIFSENGSFLGFKIQPIKNVGIYVPSGKAPYFSSLVMCAVPAIIAGVERIAVVTPPDSNGNISPLILKTCSELGIEEVYKVGGAHSIAALAYGTETIEKVDKIVGPGNVYVAIAKKMVFGDCGIDSVAGPSEIVIIADESSKTEHIAADLLSQAEHDEKAMSILITTSKQVLNEVILEVKKQLEELPVENCKVAETSIANHGVAILTENFDKAIEISNLIAPEHLEIVTKEPFELLSKIRNAGSIFIGALSSEPIGDYGIGPNHVLPTLGNARFSSGLSVSDFLKKMYLTSISKDELDKIGEELIQLAKYEGLKAHALAIEKRLRG